MMDLTFYGHRLNLPGLDSQSTMKQLFGGVYSPPCFALPVDLEESLSSVLTLAH